MAIDEGKYTYDNSVSSNTFTFPNGKTQTVKTTETIKYDAEGRVVERTVVTETTTKPRQSPWRYPYQPYWYGGVIQVADGQTTIN